jgi:hypothetical protein
VALRVRKKSRGLQGKTDSSDTSLQAVLHLLRMVDIERFFSNAPSNRKTFSVTLAAAFLPGLSISLELLLFLFLLDTVMKPTNAYESLRVSYVVL